MYIIKTLLLLLFTIHTTAAFGQSTERPPLIDRELLFGPPQIAGGQLSPDGQWMSFLKPYKGTMNIWVKKADAPFTSARLLTADTVRPLRIYFWSRDSRYVLYAQDQGGDENFNVYAVSPTDAKEAGKETPQNRALTTDKGATAYLYAAPRQDPDALYIGLNDRDKAWHDLYKLSISTGKKTLLRQNNEKDRITNWIFDWDGKVRMATRANRDGSNELLVVNGDSLTSVYHTGPFEEFNVYAFDKTNQRVYMSTNKGDRNLSELVLFDPQTKEEEVVERDPKKKVDFGNAVFSEKNRALMYTSYNNEKEELYWKDASLEKDYALMKKQLPRAVITLANSTDDENKWLVSAYSDTDPGAMYLFDRKTKKLTLQYRPRPDIPLTSLAPMKAIRYTSSDGLEIPAYLVLPKGMPAKNLPVIVLPHGGPWYRDSWGYNSWAQFLANRGYAVLLPNFRGSTGYGKAFIDAGNKQWGEKMQDDITWGVKHLVSEGIANPKKVGIMGGSYGGYATLAGVTFTPDLFAAGVAIVGPSNLITLLNSIPPYWEAYRQVFHLRMGDPSTEEGKAQLVKQSPLTHADKIKTPLMVVQGANDPRVKQAESEQIVEALRKRGFPVEYILAADEGHGFARPDNNMAMLAAAEKFLAAYLGGRYQQSMSPVIAKKLKEITVDTKRGF